MVTSAANNDCSVSPTGERYSLPVREESEQSKISGFLDKSRRTVVVQGLGFVGVAMVAALSNAKDEKERPLYNVIGLDLRDAQNYWKICRINEGKAPIVSEDKQIDEALVRAHSRGNLMATYSDYALRVADIVVIDINLDIVKHPAGATDPYSFSYANFENALTTVAKNIREETLVLVETTVPPGTTEQIILPLFQRVWKERELNLDRLYLAHSYERVTPGANYLKSVTDYYRVYSGINNASKERAKVFLESFINTRDYPLCELHSPTASEMAKVLENSYRAANIAFIQEWTEFAHLSNVNLFDVIKAIRMRPTHQNMMWPGVGVGGYCLTKDSLLADWAYRNLFTGQGHLKQSLSAIRINDHMPHFTCKLLEKSLGELKGKKIALLGISYLNDVADTRNTPVEAIYDYCVGRGAELSLHDSLVSYWGERKRAVSNSLDDVKRHDVDAVIFALRHKEYTGLTVERICELFPRAQVILDASNVLAEETAMSLMERGFKLAGVGKGHWNRARFTEQSYA